MDEIEKNNILEQIIKKFDLAKGQYIDYNLFEKIYEEYKTIFTEREFATLLGLTNSKYKNIKFYNGKASILMNIEKSVEEKENILNKLVQENDLQKGSFISYDKRDANVKCTFMELYNQYKGSFTKYEFANLLGIKNENLRNLRRNTKNQTVPKARVLMNQCATDDEKYEFYKQRIKKDIIDKYEGKKIDYDIDEMVSRAIEYMYTNCGDIERNFGKDEDMLNRMLYTRVRLYIRAECVKIAVMNNKTDSLNKKTNRGLEEKLDKLKSNKNSQYEDIENEMLVNQILEDVQEKKELGYSKKEIIQELIMEYDITPEIMKKLIERKECEKKNGEDERC